MVLKEKKPVKRKEPWWKKRFEHDILALRRYLENISTYWKGKSKQQKKEERLDKFNKSITSRKRNSLSPLKN